MRDAARGAELIRAISTPTFRPYLGTDLLGAEVGGAVKNVLAIACGIALGKGLGRSAHAALIARGYAEMTRLALALGAEAETLTGLSGLGDLVLTCSSETSRNMSLGLALGQGKSLAEVLGARHSVTEGVATAPVLRQLARARGIEMPISEAVAAVIEGEITVDEAILALLMRPVKPETVRT
jgi:glycerol-3-phosphate dehydrogenase (NAD(P)+)